MASEPTTGGGDEAPQRLFAALDLPEPVRAGLAGWGQRELTDPALRPVRAAALHMTVCFLGSTPFGRVAEAEALIGAIRPRRVPIRFALDPVSKPSGRPALLAIEAESPPAAELAGEVREALIEAGLTRAERRPFWPHVTVARVRSEPGRRRRPRRLERPPGPLPGDMGGEFDAVRLSLYRSIMRPEGSLYVPLCNLNLR